MSASQATRGAHSHARPTPGQWPATTVRVERIITAPMSRQRREQAVAALAVLITAWQHGPIAEPDEDPASPIPLPGPGERH